MKHLKHLNKYFYKYRWRLLLGAVFIAVANLFAIFPAQVIRYSFDFVEESIISYKLLNGFEVQESYYGIMAKTLLLLGLIVALSAIIKGIFMFFMRQTIIVMSRLIEYDLKNEVFEHYQKLSASFYKRNNTGDLMNRISEDVSRVRMYLGPAIMYTINLAALFILVIFTMLSVNSTLTFFCLLPMPFLFGLIYYVSHLINRQGERVQWQLSNLSTFAQESFSGIRVLKAFNREKESENFFEKQSTNYREKNLLLAKTDAYFQPLMILLVGMSTILTVFIGGNLTIAGDVTAGNIAEFVYYVNMLTWPVAMVGWVTSLVQRAAASQERINEFLHTISEIKNPTEKHSEIFGSIEFRHVSFAYSAANEGAITALKNISFRVKQGETLAITGRIGSGKSTIANLICRQYDATSGEIFIDGKNISEINLSDLRTAIGYVPQEVFLFSDTIAANIAFGFKTDDKIRIPPQNAVPAHVSKLPEEDDRRFLVEKAARDAVIYPNIMEFPDKFETVIGERGITLSGGQKQRISIARAIVKSPKILLLDDCLSAVDTETEDEIFSNLKHIMAGKTTIIISHRISSVKHADNILVLDQGTIAESGNHANLIDKKGIYYDIFQMQLLEHEKISG